MTQVGEVAVKPIMSVYRLPQGRGHVVNLLMPQASVVVGRKKGATFKQHCGVCEAGNDVHNKQSDQ